jgi:phage major head subunit gpT-like protein
MKISCSKSKTMAFLGQQPVHSKIVIENKILEQVNTFNYLGCHVSYEGEKDIQDIITKFLKKY